MYKHYKKKNYDIMGYDFDSISEFLNFLDSASINTSVFPNSYDLRSIESSYNFTRTHSYEEAINICKFGYHKDFNKLVELKMKLEKYIKQANNLPKQYNYYVGYAPDVKSYLEGNPLSMLNRDKALREHIDIYYNVSVSASTNYDEILHSGIITLSIIEILESMGISVDLHLFNMTKNQNQVLFANFNFKKSGEKINIQKLYFPLCHPSFLRRLVFRLTEVTPDILFSWKSGYGKPCDRQFVHNIIDLNSKDIVICQPSETNIEGFDIIDDANSMFKYIEDFTSDKLKFERIKK